MPPPKWMEPWPVEKAEQVIPVTCGRQRPWIINQLKQLGAGFTIMTFSLRPFPFAVHGLVSPPWFLPGNWSDVTATSSVLQHQGGKSVHSFFLHLFSPCLFFDSSKCEVGEGALRGIHERKSCAEMYSQLVSLILSTFTSKEINKTLQSHHSKKYEDVRK